MLPTKRPPRIGLLCLKQVAQRSEPPFKRLNYFQTIGHSFGTYYDAMRRSPTVLAFEIMMNVNMVLNSGVLGIVSADISRYADAHMLTPFILWVHSGLGGIIPSLVGFSLLQRQFNEIQVEQDAHASLTQTQVRQLRQHRYAVYCLMLSVGSLGLSLLASTGALALPALPFWFVLSYVGYFSFRVLADMQSAQIGMEALFVHYKQDEVRGQRTHINQYRHVQASMRFSLSSLAYLAGWLMESAGLYDAEHRLEVMSVVILSSMAGMGLIHYVLERKVKNAKI